MPVYGRPGLIFFGFKGFGGEDQQVICAIMANAKKLFVVGLPGCYVLIQPFLRCVRRLVSGDYIPKHMAP